MNLTPGIKKWTSTVQAKQFNVLFFKLQIITKLPDVCNPNRNCVKWLTSGFYPQLHTQIALYPWCMCVRLWFVLGSITKKSIHGNNANCSQILLIIFRPKFQSGMDEVQYVVLFLKPFLTMSGGNYCKVQYSLQQRNTNHDHCKANHHNV